jgi:hypothetical protein
MRKIILALVLLLGACSSGSNIDDETRRICGAATEGLPSHDHVFTECYHDVRKAGLAGQHAAAQKYRNMPRG